MTFFIQGVKLENLFPPRRYASPLATAFTVAIPSLPPTARPIVDDASGACVSYVHEGEKMFGVFLMYMADASELRKLL